MRNSYRLIGIGLAAFLAGIIGFIVDLRHRPFEAAYIGTQRLRVRETGLSGTAYDLIHVASWMLVTAGVIVIIMGLIRFSAALRRTS
jgi:uncharacterized membrane protein